MLGRGKGRLGEWIVLKIGLMSHSSPPAVNAIGSYTWSLARALASIGHEVVLITGKWHDGHEVDTPFNLKIIRLPVIDAAPRFLWFQVRNRHLINRIFEREKIDIFHGNGSECGMILGGLRAIAPTVVTIHGSPTADLKLYLDAPNEFKTLEEAWLHLLGYPVWRHLTSREYRPATAIVTVSRYVRDLLTSDFGSREISVVPQHCDVGLIDRLAKGSPRNPNQVFFSGRLIYRKGVPLLLKAFLIAHAQKPELRLHVWGLGPLSGWVRAFVDRQALTEVVTLKPYQSYERLIEEISRSSFVCLPSLFEASSVLMIEAMACSRVVLGIDAPGIKESLGVDDGALLVPENAGDLANGMIELARNDSLRTAKEAAGRRQVCEVNDVGKVVQLYEKIYEKAC